MKKEEIETLVSLEEIEELINEPTLVKFDKERNLERIRNYYRTMEIHEAVEWLMFDEHNIILVFTGITYDEYIDVTVENIKTITTDFEEAQKFFTEVRNSIMDSAYRTIESKQFKQ